MLISRRAVVAGFVSASCSKIAQAQPPSATGPELVDLEDDQSRGALFRRFIEVPAEDAIMEQEKSFVLPRSFLFPKHTKNDEKGRKRTDQLFGIDISHHNGPDIRFDLLKSQHVYFIYMKAGQGRGRDKYFKSNWKNAGKAKLYRGAYFFLSSQYSGEEQGRTFAALLGALGPHDLSPVIDLEWDVVRGNRDQWAGTKPSTIIDETLACLSTVHGLTKRKPMIYTAGSWLNERIGSDQQVARLADYPIWLADYSRSALGVEEPKAPKGLYYIVWQFTDRAQLSNGYDQAIDANRYSGSEDDFRKDFGVIAL